LLGASRGLRDGSLLFGRLPCMPYPKPRCFLLFHNERFSRFGMSSKEGEPRCIFLRVSRQKPDTSPGERRDLPCDAIGTTLPLRACTNLSFPVSTPRTVTEIPDHFGCRQ